MKQGSEVPTYKFKKFREPASSRHRWDVVQTKASKTIPFQAPLGINLLACLWYQVSGE